MEKDLRDFKQMELVDVINYDFAKEIIKNKKYRGEYENLANELLDNHTPIIRQYIIYKNYFEKADPDACSVLLKNVIKNVWNEEYLNICKGKNQIIYTDTMTSVQTLISNFYECVIKEEEGKEWENYKTKYKVKHFSKKVMEDMYKSLVEAKEEECLYPIFNYYFISDNEESRIILDFIRHYHTLGNYIPIPEGFNTSRSGNYGSHDMWDITLMKIKEYYDCEIYNDISDNNRSILELLHLDKLYANTYKWLETYGSLENFIKENYLEMYMENGNILANLEEKHGFNSPELKTKEDYLHYFKTMTDLIKIRTEVIFNKIKE